MPTGRDMRFLVVALLVATTLAGCVAEESPQAASLPLAKPDEVGLEESGQEEASQPSEGQESGGQEPDAAPGDATVDPATIPIEGGTMLATVNAEAPLAAYSFTFDNDAAHPILDGFSTERIFLSVAPVFEDAPETMIISLHSPDGMLLASRWFYPVEGTLHLTAALPSSLDGDPDYAPFTWELVDDLEGDEIVVVVGAEGLTGPAGFLLRVDDGLELFDDPRSTEYLEEQGVWTPLPIGTGTGYQAGQRVETHVGLYAPAGVLGIAYQAGTATLEERTDTWVPPHGGYRDATAAATGAGGWNYAYLSHYAGEGAVDWAYTITAGGETMEDDGLLVYLQGYGALATGIAFGLPVAVAYGDGDGATVELDTTGVTTNDIYVLVATAMGYDQSWDQLTGTPSSSYAGNFEGLMVDPETRSVTVGGAMITLA